jgi:Tol biopolymer transport system component
VRKSIVSAIALVLFLLSRCGPSPTLSKLFAGPSPTPPPGFVDLDRFAYGKYLDRPSLSSDGSYLAARGGSYRGSDINQLFVFDLQGPQLVFSTEEELWHIVSISPSNDSVAASGTFSDRSTRLGIYLVSLNGQMLSRLADGNFPTWSPSGRSLAYAVQTAGATDPTCRRQIRILDLSSVTEETVFDAACDGVFLDVAWSPQEKSLAFAEARGNLGSDDWWADLSVLELDTGDVSIIRTSSHFIVSVNYSPRGDRILYLSSNLVEGDFLVVVDLDGSCHRLDVPLEYVREVELSSDGSKIAFTTSHGLLVAETASALGDDFWTAGEPCDDP